MLTNNQDTVNMLAIIQTNWFGFLGILPIEKKNMKDKK